MRVISARLVTLIKGMANRWVYVMRLASSRRFAGIANGENHTPQTILSPCDASAG
jgi:hypothetical protein